MRGTIKRGPGRPRGTDMVLVTVRLPEVLIDRIDALVGERGGTRSDLIRGAVGQAFGDAEAERAEESELAGAASAA